MKPSFVSWLLVIVWCVVATGMIVLKQKDTYEERTEGTKPQVHTQTVCRYYVGMKPCPMV